MSNITIKIEHAEELTAAFRQFPEQANKYLAQAGKEAGSRIILPTEGLKRYPSATGANSPPTPYYVRGVGMQYMRGNNNKSERYGTKFYVSSTRPGVTEIGNVASYAPYLADEELQAQAMGAKGWRKLQEVAEEKIDEITEVYNLWVEKLIKDIGLK
jgi:hypothetical protein